MFGEQLVTKMWDTLVKGGIGSLASPWQIKREGRAHAEVRRDEMLMLAQAEVEAKAIKEGRKKLLSDGKLIELHQDIDSHDPSCYLGRVEPTLVIEKILSNIEQQKKAENIQSEININKTILMTEEELSNSQTPLPKEDINIDWLYRWRDYVSQTENEDLRRLWARTLAGETKCPGTYSMRTLEFIKNLSQDEAISISKLGMFTTAKILFKSDTLNSNDIDFEFLLQMEDLGIISGVQGGNVSSLEVTMKSNYADKFSNQIINKNRILLIHSDDPKKEVKLPIYKVTKLGEDILSLGDFKANDDFMRDIGHKIKQQGFEVTLATWLQTTTEYGNYFNPELI